MNGYDVTKEPSKVRESIGIVFQDPSLDNRLTGRENMEMHAELYGVDALRTTLTGTGHNNPILDLAAPIIAAAITATTGTRAFKTEE